MVKKTKKVWLLLFALLLIVTSNAKALVISRAAEIQREIQPYWQNASEMIVALSINSEKATLSTSIEGKKGVNKITAVAVLERQNSNGTYTEIARWDNLISSSSTLNWTATRYVTNGYTYRFTITATLYKDGVGETITASKSTPA